MNAEAKAINFKELIASVTDKRNWWGSDRLAIWGGTCAESQLRDFLDDWGLPKEGVDYVIWEYMDAIKFLKAGDPEATLKPDGEKWLERGRIFSARGDLTLRRGGDIFRWHFIGEANEKPPQGFDGDENNFWKTDPDAKFLMREESALLWGERKEEQPRWFEDRVARAILVYPTISPIHGALPVGRVRIHYRTFSRAGQVEFVWLTRLGFV